MAIEKLIVGVTGVPSCSFHHVWEGLVVYPPFGQNGAPRVRVQVYSWESEAKKAAGGPILWNWVLPEQLGDTFVIPISALEDIENYLSTTEGSPFKGGAVINTAQGPSLESARAKKWAQIQNEYQLRAQAPLTTPFGVVDSDAEVSQMKMLQAHALAKALEDAGQPVAIPWSMADGPVVELTSSSMVMSMGFALAQRELELRFQRNNIKALIAEASTVAQVENLHWGSTEVSPVSEPAFSSETPTPFLAP